MHSSSIAAIAFALLGYSFAYNAEAPMITAAARLLPRQSDPEFVGYISANGAYSNPRSCDPTETVSTSGAYFQCCPTAGSSCAFYTACRDNTLFAAGGASVDCYVNAALTCNTGIVLQTPGANNGASYLACWQTSLGTGAFTFVQTTGGGSGGGAAASSTASSGSGATESSGGSGASASSTGAMAGSQTVTGSPSSAAASSSGSSATSSAKANAAGSAVMVGGSFFGGLVGLLAAFVL